MNIDLHKLPAWPQSQDSVSEQLAHLIQVANRLGLYDAADAVKQMATNLKELSDYEQSMADQPLWSLAMHAGESTPGTGRDAFAAELRVIIDWLVPENDRMILSPTNQPGEYFRWLERKRLREMLLAEADKAEESEPN